MSINIQQDDRNKAKVVFLIPNRRSITNFSKFYKVIPHEIIVGTIKGKRRTICVVYVQREVKIYCINSDIFYNQFIVLHEFYYHLRTKSSIHSGSEKHASIYAKGLLILILKEITK